MPKGPHSTCTPAKLHMTKTAQSREVFLCEYGPPPAMGFLQSWKPGQITVSRAQPPTAPYTCPFGLLKGQPDPCLQTCAPSVLTGSPFPTFPLLPLSGAAGSVQIWPQLHLFSMKGFLLNLSKMPQF